MEKYSKFGLSFTKEFLIDAGASPVFYVANESPAPVVAGVLRPGDFADRIKAAAARGIVDRALYFDTSVRGLLDLCMAFDALCCTEDTRYCKGNALPVSECKTRLRQLLGLSDAQVASAELALKGNAQATTTLRVCLEFLLNFVFSFIKCFEAKRGLDDNANYYMEREWRVGGNVAFRLSDVSRVFFPRKYATRFRADLPEYMGQISFID